ncbi:MAG: YjdJ family protein [Paenisporosarcina sp.]
MRYWIQYSIIIIVLVLSTLASWYEGSELVNNPWEWKYSIPFSRMLNEEVINKTDIFQLDYFIYSLKYQPLYPLLMMMSILYLVFLSAYLLIRKSMKKYSLFLGIAGILLLLTSVFTNDFSSQGGQYGSLQIITVGIVSLLFAVGYLFKEYLNLLVIPYKNLPSVCYNIYYGLIKNNL